MIDSSAPPPPTLLSDLRVLTILPNGDRDRDFFFISPSPFLLRIGIGSIVNEATVPLVAVSEEAHNLATLAKNIIMAAGDGDVPAHNHATITNPISNLTHRAVFAIKKYCQINWQQQRHHLRRRCRHKLPPPLRLTPQTKSTTEVDSIPSSEVRCQARPSKKSSLASRLCPDIVNESCRQETTVE